MVFPKTLPVPDEVLRIAETLEDAGFETWCVGGVIRDFLLGYESKDFDLATTATPQEMQQLFRKTIPVGIKHGTVAILDRNNSPHEATTFRQDVKTDGRHAEVEFGVSLEADLARRDFTINAIAYHPLRHTWVDLFDGAGDLEVGIVRCVGDPNRRFREDYLRILRALRFAARFGFKIEPATWLAAKQNVDGLQYLSAERVREEWFLGLRGCRSVKEFFGLWMDVGAIENWLQEMGQGETACSTASVIEGIDRQAIRDPVLVTSFLSSDPATTLERLKCSRAEIHRGRSIGRLRDRWPDPDSEVGVRKWLSLVGEATDDLVALAMVVGMGEDLEDAVERVRGSGAPLTLGALAITGEDLINAGFRKGPSVGRTLRVLLTKVLECPDLNTRSKLLELACSKSDADCPAADG